MNIPQKQRSALAETMQSGLSLWTGRTNGTLPLPENMHACERFIYEAFEDRQYPVMIQDQTGKRLVRPLAQSKEPALPDRLSNLADLSKVPSFVTLEYGLDCIFYRLGRWPLSPTEIIFLGVFIELDHFNVSIGMSLAPSEYALVGLSLACDDL